MSTKDSLRFKGPGLTIWNYSKEIFVECPQCSGRALVQKDGIGFWNDKSAKLCCTNCHYRQDQPRKYYDLEVKFYCSSCGTKVEQRIENVDRKKKSVAITCPSCSFSQAYRPCYIERTGRPVNATTAYDPVYKLPLWLAAEFKGRIFWAFNYEHLAHIKGQVAAKLRIKNKRPYATMLEKLPAWIISRKNRKGILKVIERLELK